ncbi:hypothetical protein MNBD_ALPHA06-425, partial [hydrothermal vent metagenome]
TPFAQGTGRIGILIEGGSVFTGNITNDSAGSINVEGNDSAGILVAGIQNGNLNNAGVIQMLGDRAHGISVTGQINGDIDNTGTITARGDGSSAIRITGDIDGAIRNSGSISATGFRSVIRLDVEQRALLDEDDLLAGGATLAIGANVNGGILNDRFTADDGTIAIGSIQSNGSAPALLVSASLDGNDNGDIVIGAVGLAADDEDFGIINRGSITVNGVNDGFAATGIRVEGTDINGTMRTATIEGGILQSGTIATAAFEANATGISIGNDAIVPLIDVRGIITANAVAQNGVRAAAIVVESGAQVNEIRINSLIQVSYIGTGVGGFAAGVIDESGTVNLLLNNGQILARFSELLPDGVEIDPTDTTRRAVSVDLSANNNGATLRQITAVDETPDDGVDPLTPAIEGDVLFGSGNDTLELAGGTLQGDVLFGDGDDLLLIDNGAELTGALFDSDGQLELDIRDGLLALGSDTTLSLNSASFGAASRLQLTIDPTGTGGVQSATFNASGSVNFLTGARIAPILSGLIGDGGTFDLLTAGSFSFADDFATMLDSNSLPFLYNVGLSQDVGSDTLVVTLSRRNATQLGMDTNQASVYEAWFEAVATSTDTALTGGFAGLATSDDFFAAYDQVLPEFGAASLQFTLANTDGTTGAIGNRLDAIRRGYGPSGGVWIQEIGYYMDRNRSSISQPYNGFGLGLALGIDRPWGGFGAIGLSLSGFSNQITQTVGFDTPLSSVSVQVGAYAGRSFGGFDLISHSAIGLDSFDSERSLRLGSVERNAKASWRGYHLASTTKLSRDFEMGRWLFSPSVSMDYLRLTEEGYKETGGGTGVDLALDSRLSENISVSASMTLGRKFGRKNSWWAPRLRAGVRNDIKGDAAFTTARFSGFDTRFNLRPDELPKTAILAGISITAGSRYTSFGFDYDADIRDGFVRHVGKIVIRFIF